MKRLLCLVAAVPLMVVVPGEPGQAHAGPTCQGQPATIVGDSQDHLVGTEGDDVIVSGGVGSVEALGGDDLICAVDADFYLDIDAGPGDDVVDTTATDPTTELLYTALGTGADRFVGGPANDQVWDEKIHQHSDPGRDVIDTGAGNDHVDTGADGLPNHDVVDLGTGRRDGVGFHGAPGGLPTCRATGSTTSRSTSPRRCPGRCG